MNPIYFQTAYTYMNSCLTRASEGDFRAILDPKVKLKHEIRSEGRSANSSMTMKGVEKVVNIFKSSIFNKLEEVKIESLSFRKDDKCNRINIYTTYTANKTFVTISKENEFKELVGRYALQESTILKFTPENKISSIRVGIRQVQIKEFVEKSYPAEVNDEEDRIFAKL